MHFADRHEDFTIPVELSRPVFDQQGSLNRFVKKNISVTKLFTHPVKPFYLSLGLNQQGEITVDKKSGFIIYDLVKTSSEQDYELSIKEYLHFKDFEKMLQLRYDKSLELFCLDNNLKSLENLDITLKGVFKLYANKRKWYNPFSWFKDEVISTSFSSTSTLYDGFELGLDELIGSLEISDRTSWEMDLYISIRLSQYETYSFHQNLSGEEL